jgi:hypothetical protein
MDLAGRDEAGRWGRSEREQSQKRPDNNKGNYTPRQLARMEICGVLLSETRKAACRYWRGCLCPMMRCFAAVRHSISPPPWRWGVGWETRGEKGERRQRNGMEWNHSEDEKGVKNSEKRFGMESRDVTAFTALLPGIRSVLRQVGLLGFHCEHSFSSGGAQLSRPGTA